MRPTVIRERLTEVTDSLSALGLSIEVLRDSILAGETARDMCTANDPSNAAGFDAWARSIRNLREQLIALGWTRSDAGGLPVVISPSGSLAVTVATGDEGTGKPELTPKTKYPKDRTTVAVVTCNRTHRSATFLSRMKKRQALRIRQLRRGSCCGIVSMKPSMRNCHFPLRLVMTVASRNGLKELFSRQFRWTQEAGFCNSRR